MILAVLLDRDPVMRHVARAVTDLRTEVVATHVPDLHGLASTLAEITPDLVVTDLTVTQRGPHDALRAVRDLWPGPLASLSGDTSVAADSAGVEFVAARWFKPLYPHEIADAIRAHMASQPQVTR